MTGDLPADFEIDDNDQVKLANERFKSSGEIEEVCRAMVSADRRRAPWRASIDGLIDGNPTYSLGALKAKGQGWRARVNYQEALGLINGRQTPFYDMVFEVDPCVEVCLDYGKGVDKADWEQSMARHFHWMLMSKWRSGMNYHVPLCQLEMLKHGIGFHVWPGKKQCWLPRTPKTGDVLFPDGCTVNLKEDLEFFMLRDFMPAYALYGYIRNEEAAKNLGWNVDTVWSALAQSSKVRHGGHDRSSIEMFQREMKAGDLGTSMSRQAGLWLNTLFVKEIGTGKISQYTVAEGVTVNQRKGSTKDDPFRNCLFRKRNKFDEWPLCIFNYDIGNGYLHSIRGLGSRTKDFFELSNRLKNAMADQVLVGSTINLKQNGPIDRDKLKLMRLGMMSIIPQGLEPVTGFQFPPLTNGPIALLRELQGTLSDNNQSYMNGTPEPKDRETAQSFTMRAQDNAQVAKGTHSLYSSNLQQFYDMMLRRAFSSGAAQGYGYDAVLAKELQERCKKDGVPKEAFNKIYEIKEVTSTGAGSAASRIQALTTILQLIYPTTTEARKINIERDLVATLVSSSKTDRYARNITDNDLPDSDASLAVQENNGMAQGGDALMAPTQNHVEHLQQHLAKATEIAQAVMNGQLDPAQGLVIIQKFGQHMAKHLGQLQGNPMRKQEFEALKKEWLSLSVIADKLQQQVEESQNSQVAAPEQRLSDTLQLGMAKLENDGRLKQAKFEIDSGIKIRKAALNERIQSRKAALQLNGSAG